MASLMRTQTLLRACPQRCAFTPVKPTFAPVSRPAVERGALVVMAAEAKKDQKKKMPSPVKRALLAEERRLYNKSRKSACATRVKKVIKMAESLMSTADAHSEDQVKALEKLVSEAYTEIDKAVVKGILHENTAARKKARCARYKKHVLMFAGLYKPAEDSEDYARFLRLQAKAAEVRAKEATQKPKAAAA
ncbi:plastid/chloroplast ribosomal protein S20 [Volvox carteri f. nagariensis]|uniref:Plastid/chloroplast ribosomal protein S20 n=1 Tax=Volvox carteri f. nagariensis TaxID=3068 RepID=D8U6K0_VOLCA|nr:plastid/chloroplast ribosomal protein S20 [Volvox carteri f. nagariensis]EFJ44660.1 plastid/chloroplast ribosomal protein S20 [Volvox carteri f. nagariensis]|eukprot:XP_002954236.1 plastid/chloroplast ribosomal protein S20 [Volvox carteri f. nagariensis]